MRSFCWGFLTESLAALVMGDAGNFCSMPDIVGMGAGR